MAKWGRMNAVIREVSPKRGASLSELQALGRKVARLLPLVEIRRAAPRMDNEARIAMLSVLKPAVLGVPPEFAATDRILLRWAASVGSGLKSEGDPAEATGYPPLPDDQAILVDRAIQFAPDAQRQFVVLWYKTPMPRSQIAMRLGISRSTLYVERNAMLSYFQQRFRALGLSA